MSKLEELIKELCPDGVEYVSIASLLDDKRIVTITPTFKIKRNDYNTTGKTPIVSQEIELISGYTDLVDKNIPQDEYVCFGDHSEHIKFINFAFAQGADGLKIIKIIDKEIVAKYLYYAVSSNYKKHNNYERHYKYFVDTQIPLPPLAVQREIVRMLDKFTLLSAELAAELAARKKQYEYYRDMLLNFDKFNGGGYRQKLILNSECVIRNAELGEVAFVRLGDIGSVCMCKRIMKFETSSEGEVPFYKIGTFGQKPNAFISKELFEKYKEQYSFPKKGDVLISAAGTIGKTVIYDGEPAYFQDSNIVWLEHDENLVLNKYLYYCYQLQPWKVSTGGTIARIYNENIENAVIPVPPIEEQNRIVSILDRFDKLCNDISEGLPAEIEARQKQYEFYRDKLLNFNS